MSSVLWKPFRCFCLLWSRCSQVQVKDLGEDVSGAQADSVAVLGSDSLSDAFQVLGDGNECTSSRCESELNILVVVAVVS